MLKKELDKIRVSIMWEGTKEPFTMILDGEEALRVYLKRAYGYYLKEGELNNKKAIEFDFDGDGIWVEKIKVRIYEEE